MGAQPSLTVAPQQRQGVKAPLRFWLGLGLGLGVTGFGGGAGSLLFRWLRNREGGHLVSLG
jgi:hypothetical protein